MILDLWEYFRVLQGVDHNFLEIYTSLGYTPSVQGTKNPPLLGQGCIKYNGAFVLACKIVDFEGTTVHEPAFYMTPIGQFPCTTVHVRTLRVEVALNLMYCIKERGRLDEMPFKSDVQLGSDNYALFLIHPITGRSTPPAVVENGIDSARCRQLWQSILASSDAWSKVS